MIMEDHQLTSEGSKLSDSAFVIYKKTGKSRWKLVDDLEAEFKYVMRFNKDFDWLDLLTTPDDAQSLELEICNQLYLIVKLDKIRHKSPMYS